MAKLTIFSYHPGRSMIHQLDVRFKLTILVVINLVSLQSGLGGIAFLTVLPGLMLFHIRVSVFSVLKETRLFLFLLLFIFISRTLSTPGYPIFEYGIVSISAQGLEAGFLMCWRLLVILFVGFVFVHTSPLEEIKAAVGWFLKPVPGIPEQRVGIMLSLMIRFIPVLLDQATETSMAQKARAVENRKNPLFRLITFSIPYIKRIFKTADQLILAMEARCYSEDRTDPELSSKSRDWTIFFIVSAYCIIIMLLNLFIIPTLHFFP